MRSNYTAEFYQASFNDEEHQTPLGDALSRVAENGGRILVDDQDPIVLIHRIEVSGAGIVSGVVWKIRREDLPTAGTPEGAERAIELAEDEGIVFKNHFVLYPRHQVFVYERCRDGLTGSQLAINLSAGFGRTYSLDPVVEPDAIQRMMNARAELRRAEFTVAKPSNPELIGDSAFGARVMALHREAGGKSLHVRLGTDLRSNDEGHHRLVGDLKQFLAHTVRSGATKSAKVKIEDPQGVDLVNLVSDRLICEQTLDIAGDLTGHEAMIKSLMAAYEEKREPLRRYFGD